MTSLNVTYSDILVSKYGNLRNFQANKLLYFLASYDIMFATPPNFHYIRFDEDLIDLTSPFSFQYIKNSKYTLLNSTLDIPFLPEHNILSPVYYTSINPELEIIEQLLNSSSNTITVHCQYITKEHKTDFTLLLYAKEIIIEENQDPYIYNHQLRMYVPRAFIDATSLVKNRYQTNEEIRKKVNDYSIAIQLYRSQYEFRYRFLRALRNTSKSFPTQFYTGKTFVFNFDTTFTLDMSKKVDCYFKAFKNYVRNVLKGDIILLTSDIKEIVQPELLKDWKEDVQVISPEFFRLVGETRVVQVNGYYKKIFADRNIITKQGMLRYLNKGGNLVYFTFDEDDMIEYSNLNNIKLINLEISALQVEDFVECSLVATRRYLLQSNIIILNENVYELEKTNEVKCRSFEYKIDEDEEQVFYSIVNVNNSNPYMNPIGFIEKSKLYFYPESRYYNYLSDHKLPDQLTLSKHCFLKAKVDDDTFHKVHNISVIDFGYCFHTNSGNVYIYD